MIKFQFDGVNADGKKVGGFLFSEDEAQARAKLKENGYAVLNISPFQENDAEDAYLSNFEFRGLKDKKFVQGTIQANDPYQAYKKLRGDYGLELEYILPTGLSLKEKNELKAAGIDPEMVDLYDEEFKVSKSDKDKDAKAKQESKLKAQVLSTKRKKKMDFYRITIEKTLEDLTVILEALEKKIDPNKLRELQERADTLSRLRNSNSIEHLDGLVRKLFKELRELELNPDLDDDLKGQISKSVTGMNEKFEKSAKKIEIDLSFVDAEKIKKTIIDLRIVQNITRTLYWIFFFLFVFCVGTLLMLALIGLIKGDQSQTLFFWSSGIYLFFLSFSAGMVLFYYPLLFASKYWSIRKKVIYGSVTIVLWLIYAIQFPVMFSWT